MSFTSYEIENDEKFKRALERARAVTTDLTLPLTMITKDFYKSQSPIFMLQSAGKYPDFGGFSPGATVTYRGQKMTRREAAKMRKQEQHGFIYPLLMAKGRLAGSVTNPTHPDAINQIINKRTLIIGTKVPYGIFHQSDATRKKIPQRKFLFIGPESSFANSDQQGRVGRWLNILNSFILKKLGEPT